jgi:uncharacterized protein YodC (DUF2158 family)
MTKGDLVKFKDGGATMIVVSVGKQTADCVWYDGKKYLGGEFSLDSLEPAPSFEFIGRPPVQVYSK